MIGHSDMITLVSFLISTTHVFFQGGVDNVSFYQLHKKSLYKNASVRGTIKYVYINILLKLFS